MIYLRNIPAAQAVKIPRTARIFGAEGWALTLQSKATGKEAVFGGLKDTGGLHTYVVLEIKIGQKQVANGEYLYTLRREGAVVSEGIATVGMEPAGHKQYNEKRTVIQYNG